MEGVIMANLRIIVKMIYILIVFNSLWIMSCAVNPVTGKSELMLLSEADEIKLGQQTDGQIVQIYGIYDSEKLHEYINDLGQKMVKISHRPHLKFEFRVMDSPVINAFAVPGGYVYITRGILAYLNNEAELAGVIGHEIGHVTARHSAKQYTNAQFAQLGLGIGSILSEEFAKYAPLAAGGIQLLFLKFSRDNESQSDDLGVEYSTKIGYDAREMSNFFVTLDKMSDQSEGKGLPTWFSTHPNPEDRVGDIRVEAAKWQKQITSKDLKVNRDNYLNTINGVVYGENPRQGFVDNDVFYHPDMKFKFPIPSAWKVSNLPTQVQIQSQDGKAAILFTLAQEKTTAAAAQSFISNTKATVVSKKDLKVHGFKATKMLSTISDQSNILQILSYFIEKDNRIYVFHGFTNQALFSNYESTFQATMEEFNVLKDKAKLNVKPDRLKMRRTSKTMTLQEALKTFGVADKDLEQMALINGNKLNDNIPAKTLIKTVAK
jgi:predicted Zn-dependent protease